ncbi:hypothetical protein AB0L65_17010 [Nonomuraea sp. NPDC052116]|uniref:hypothetical protein n=1 Tax=Nonomuraea sp. NPDC052116 TaxID=3155665 RepID=UPI00341E7088
MTNHSPGTGAYPQPPYQQPFTQPRWQPAAPVVRPARPGRRFLAHGLTAIVSLIIGVGIGAGSDAETSASPRPIVTVTETAQAASAPAATETITAEPVVNPEEEGGPQTTFPGDGQYLVGEDIKPGTYKTAGADSSNCYWARLKNASGEFDAIIANDNIKGQTRVTLKKGEFFETNGCQDWKRVG